MHQGVVSDCDEWHKRNKKKENVKVNQKKASSTHNKGKMVRGCEKKLLNMVGISSCFALSIHFQVYLSTR